MDIDSLIQRINELAKKYKSTGLTEEETQERASLRETYLQNVRNNFRNQLDTIEFTDDLPKSGGNRK
ncbi:DUF896 domain-containing protein [Paenibacillus sp. DS2015]|uniref:DUF896 domain-containing protein n=1 Tax=Paenibacillus sp. DS2015 TaxID=3373917 RepID=UPI003D23648A